MTAFRRHYEPSVLSVRCNTTQAEYYCSYLSSNATTALAWRQTASSAHGHALIRLNSALVNSLLVTELQLTARQPRESETTTDFVFVNQKALRNEP